jgi:hypothetical protein
VCVCVFMYVYIKYMYILYSIGNLVCVTLDVVCTRKSVVDVCWSTNGQRGSPIAGAVVCMCFIYKLGNKLQSAYLRCVCEIYLMCRMP